MEGDVDLDIWSEMFDNYHLWSGQLGDTALSAPPAGRADEWRAETRQNL